MEITLPKSKKVAVLKDYLPHKVVARYNEEMFRGVELGQQALTVTKDNLIEEFGSDVVAKLDELPENQYQAEFEKLRNQYLQRKLEMKGMDLGNIERANMAKVQGMVLSLDGKSPKLAELEDLPQRDFELVLEKIEEISSADDDQNLGEPSEG